MKKTWISYSFIFPCFLVFFRFSSWISWIDSVSEKQELGEWLSMDKKTYGEYEKFGLRSWWRSRCLRSSEYSQLLSFWIFLKPLNAWSIKNEVWKSLTLRFFTSVQLVDLESPDLVVPRRNIASGKTPVAARESVVRYQMACKEDDYTYTEKFRYFRLPRVSAQFLQKFLTIF